MRYLHEMQNKRFKDLKKKNQANSKKFKDTQGSFWSLREIFLTQRVATL